IAMTAERQRVSARISELAAEGRPDFEYLAETFGRPGQLLGGEDDEPPAGQGPAPCAKCAGAGWLARAPGAARCPAASRSGRPRTGPGRPPPGWLTMLDGCGRS